MSIVLCKSTKLVFSRFWELIEPTLLNLQELLVGIAVKRQNLVCLPIRDESMDHIELGVAPLQKSETHSRRLQVLANRGLA